MKQVTNGQVNNDSDTMSSNIDASFPWVYHHKRCQVNNTEKVDP